LARDDDALVTLASLVYLAFALGLWPFWVPFSVLFLERRPRRRWCLGAAALFGLAFGCLLYVPLALQPDDWLRVGVVGHSIWYNPDGLPAFDVVPHQWWDAGYGVIVFVPLLAATSDRRFAVFFLTLAASGAVGLFAFRHAFVSVWCFFAALLSAQLCLIFSALDRRHTEPHHR
jgi:hypothetical protein